MTIKHEQIFLCCSNDTISKIHLQLHSPPLQGLICRSPLIYSTMLDKKDSKYGYLLTNNHVIEDMEKVTLVTSEEKEIELKSQ